MNDHRGLPVVSRTRLTFLGCSLLLSWTLAQSVQADEADDTALLFVQERHLGDSLGWLGYQVASRSVTFASIVEAVGKNQAQDLVHKELQRLQPDYQVQWDRNLAAAYAQSFSAQELQSLNEGSGSLSLLNKLKVRSNEVGIRMKERSSELLETFVAQALGNAQKSLAR
ncbi:hypothetical protein [Pseudomonas capsici]|uniref:DUF2059 domain-containing protein n=1 Tax=Pseudomonas capsici TaxID=2810614 RepID=A0ABT3BZI6_9PSED|nr:MULTISPECIES: hypothetical protein [Pseudomonas]MBX8475800.1 hypothetical protein [Pseudomonas cichorii]MBX8607088.1 hypothetical protein [Pseudomonas cichorii]MBX8613469.1 hypothetical protein [Pseudomonas cichorii]MCV4265060.1 hypothetical protein [Pseudomonas capsici]MCV4270794.1 hypothetical protein [Pseudomonas capsici]